MSNQKIVFLSGRSDTGKSTALRNLRNPEGVLYLNFEAKALPFKHNFIEKRISDPYMLHTYCDKLIEAGTAKFHTLVIDSITACMALYAAKYIGKDCDDKRAAWGDYGSFYDKWAKQQLPYLKQQIIVLAHIDYIEEPSGLDGYFQAVVQGRLQKIGLEADFGLVVNTAILSVEKLKEFNNPHLNITEDDEIEEFKHVLQTRKTLETKDTKIRSPLGMWEKNETYIDPDVQIVLDKLEQYYN